MSRNESQGGRIGERQALAKSCTGKLRCHKHTLSYGFFQLTLFHEKKRDGAEWW